MRLAAEDSDLAPDAGVVLGGSLVPDSPADDCRVSLLDSIALARIDGLVTRFRTVVRFQTLPRRPGVPSRLSPRVMRSGVSPAFASLKIRRELQAQGIVVRCPSNRGLAEEAPFAYKDVERVVEVVERAGLARRVAQLRPLGVVKG
jgi:hypothetical protein